MDIQKTGPIFPQPHKDQTPQTAERRKSQEPFTETVKSFLKDVNNLQLQAGSQIESLIAGETTDIHDVMIAVEKASVGFEMAMEIRNKILEAYKEVMRMQV